MGDLRGDIWRAVGRGGRMPSGYRDPGINPDSKKAAERCKFVLPADAALIYALMPAGLGEEASDGSLKHVYCGLDFLVEPWTLPPQVPTLLLIQVRPRQRSASCWSWRSSSSRWGAAPWASP